VPASRLAGRAAVIWFSLWAAAVTAALILVPPPPDARAINFIQRDGRFGLYARDLTRGITAPVFASRTSDVITYEWSPDGRSLAVITLPLRRASGRTLWIRRPAQRPLHVQNLSTSHGPYWSPDSTAIVQVYQNRIGLLDVTTGQERPVPVTGIFDIDSSYYIPLDRDHVLLRGRTAAQPDGLRLLRVNLNTGIATPQPGLPCDANPRELVPAPGDAETLIYGCFFEGMLMITEPNGPEDALDKPLVLFSDLGGLGTAGAPHWSPDGERVMLTFFPTFTAPNAPPFRVFSASLDGEILEEIDLPAGANEADWLPPVTR